MTLVELDKYFRSFIEIDEYFGDPSQNGIQVQNSNPEGKEIKKVAFAVDACLETITRAAQAGADLLFVHHGMFWSHSELITGMHYRKIKALMDNDMALYGCHIPLDANAVVGNNYGLAKRLNLQNIEPFGEWRGMVIGVCGALPEPMTADELAGKVLAHGERPLHILPFGKKQIKTVGIISGGAGSDLHQAIECGLDAYVTGEVSHELYHVALENQITMIAAGHYQTETVGVSLVMEKLAKEKGLETVFIDVPTGL